jgi:hypothetical protein
VSKRLVVCSGPSSCETQWVAANAAAADDVLSAPYQNMGR